MLTLEYSRTAAVLREAIRVGAAEVVEVVKWADEAIVKQDDPPAALLNLSMMASSHPLDVIHELRKLSESVSVLEVLPDVLIRAHQVLSNEPAYGETLARCLYDIYGELNYEVPERFNRIAYFDSAFGLAHEGTWGTEEEARAELLAFTGSFVANANKTFEVTGVNAGTST